MFNVGKITEYFKEKARREQVIRDYSRERKEAIKSGRLEEFNQNQWLIGRTQQSNHVARIISPQVIEEIANDIFVYGRQSQKLKELEERMKLASINPASNDKFTELRLQAIKHRDRRAFLAITAKQFDNSLAPVDYFQLLDRIKPKSKPAMRVVR